MQFNHGHEQQPTIAIKGQLVWHHLVWPDWANIFAKEAQTFGDFFKNIIF